MLIDDRIICWLSYRGSYPQVETLDVHFEEGMGKLTDSLFLLDFQSHLRNTSCINTRGRREDLLQLVHIFWGDWLLYGGVVDIVCWDSDVSEACR